MKTKVTQIQRDLVEACHAMAAAGCGGVIGGHVSIRVPGENTYWVNVIDRCFEEMTVEDMVHVDFDGNVLQSSRPVSIGIAFHHGIYGLRPDVGAIVHTHGRWMTAQSAFARPPKMWENLCTLFYNKVAISPDDTFEKIGPAIGKDNIAVIIPWHGAINVGKTVGEAAALHTTFDYACWLDMQLANSGAQTIPDEYCERIVDTLTRQGYLGLTWDLLRRKVKSGMGVGFGGLGSRPILAA